MRVLSFDPSISYVNYMYSNKEIECVLKINPFRTNTPKYLFLTRSIQDSETSIDFVQGPPGSRRERVKRKNTVFYHRIGNRNVFMLIM